MLPPIGTHHATPSLETLELVIGLATSRVFSRLAPGSVQPAATPGLGELVAVGAMPEVAAPDVVALGKQWTVLALGGLVLPQPLAGRPATNTRGAPTAIVGRHLP